MFARYFTLLCLLVLTAGCVEHDPNVPSLYPVSGVVTLDGTPLPRASVELTPMGETLGTPSWGLTDEQGRYELRSVQGRVGVPQGEFAVIVSKNVRPDGSEIPPDVGDLMTEPHKQLLPARYSEHGRTQLTATIPEGGRDDLDFALESK